jgi:restriction system protein
MAIPKYDEITLPLLRLLSDGKEHHLRDLVANVSEHFELSEDERIALLPSGQSTYIHNRTSWAGFDLKKAELAEATKRSTLRITPKGRSFLETQPTEKLDRKALLRFDPFRRYTETLRRRPDEGEAEEKFEAKEEETTPDERIEQADRELRVNLAAELLAQMARMDPYRFEQLVLDLLRAMGYGGPRDDSGWVTRKSGDGGIDGVINEDRLGLDVIYLQAKRWQGNVGTNEIRNFIGALSENHAHKGVFITTSDFVPAARELTRRVSQKVILIDGQRLEELMIEHGIGVTTTRTIALKRIDSDYFEEA